MTIKSYTMDMEMSDAEFGSVVGCDRVTVHDWRKRGHLPTPLVLGAGLKAMYLRLREQAALRLGHTDGLDLVAERAALAKAQREGIELKNQVLRREHADVALLERVLAASASAVVEQFEHLPARIRTACPALPQEALDVAVAVLASARNEWAAGMAKLVLDQVLPDDDLEPEQTQEGGGDDRAS